MGALVDRSNCLPLEGWACVEARPAALTQPSTGYPQSSHESRCKVKTGWAPRVSQGFWGQSLAQDHPCPLPVYPQNSVNTPTLIQE